MARRVVMGRMPNGSYDLRISRRGFDALAANVNDPRQISFSAQRAARAKVGAAGFASSLGAWVGLGKTFAYPPPTIMAFKTGGRVIFNHYQYLPTDTSNGVFFGSPVCLVVQPGQVRIIRANNWGSYSMQAGDRVLFYTLSQD
jgi:hypothetical protein